MEGTQPQHAVSMGCGSAAPEQVQVDPFVHANLQTICQTIGAMMVDLRPDERRPAGDIASDLQDTMYRQARLHQTMQHMVACIRKVFASETALAHNIRQRTSNIAWELEADLTSLRRKHRTEIAGPPREAGSTKRERPTSTEPYGPSSSADAVTPSSLKRYKSVEEQELAGILQELSSHFPSVLQALRTALREQPQSEAEFVGRLELLLSGVDGAVPGALGRSPAASCGCPTSESAASSLADGGDGRAGSFASVAASATPAVEPLAVILPEPEVWGRLPVMLQFPDGDFFSTAAMPPQDASPLSGGGTGISAIQTAATASARGDGAPFDFWQ